jgi:hypothetical protein
MTLTRRDIATILSIICFFDLKISCATRIQREIFRFDSWSTRPHAPANLRLVERRVRFCQWCRFRHLKFASARGCPLHETVNTGARTSLHKQDGWALVTPLVGLGGLGSGSRAGQQTCRCVSVQVRFYRWCRFRHLKFANPRVSLSSSIASAQVRRSPSTRARVQCSTSFVGGAPARLYRRVKRARLSRLFWL